MLVAKIAFSLAVLFLASLASEARHLSRFSRILRLNDDRSSRSWERQEGQDQYFEQCRFVDAWKEHLGFVSVLAFLDPAWQYSFRQAVMLELLSSRLRKSGFPDIRFFVISPSSDSMENERNEDDLEIEAWREIGARHEMESLVDHDFLKSYGSDITFLQDDSRFRMWERFRASKDQVITIDRCGKLTYHVIVPWSILFFPYVKAAILSTYVEDPCGECDPPVYKTPVNDEEENPMQSKTDANWTTESLENTTLRHELLEEEREASTASSIFKKFTNNTDLLNVSTESPTESTLYRYDNDTAESLLDEDRSNAENTRDQENSTLSKDGIPSGITTTFEPQRDVFLPEEERSHPSANNNAKNRDRILLLGEPVTDEIENVSTPANEETTTLDFTDETRDRNITSKNTESFGKDAFLPLRIIMYAPHVHKNDGKTKKHTHLILKTSDLSFHEHFDFEVSSSMNSRMGSDSHVTNSKEYDWEIRKADEDEENANQKYMFGKDESPGLYGEVADYWKQSYEDNDITDRNETFNDTYNNSMTDDYDEEHSTNINDHATNLSKSEGSYSVADITKDPNVQNCNDSQNIVNLNTIESSRPININNQLDREEEQHKLTEHYKKLLSWIDYRLNK